MINNIMSLSLVGLVALCIGAVSVSAREAVAQHAPVIINDRELIDGLANKLGEITLKHKGISSDDLKSQFARTETTLALLKKKQGVLDDLYGSSMNSVGMISSVYKCDKCPDWHLKGMATCWVLTDDGVMVSNYHIFKDKEVASFGIQTRDGHVAPVIEILATDKDADICIFRVTKKEGGYQPLAMGNAQKVGGNAHIIAHPDRRYYTYTSGKVSRYYYSRNKARKCYYMGVTADYARGSSGGPVMDDEGNVIGMVASTNSIYYPSKDKKDPKGNFQMTIKNCVPVDAIRKMVKNSNS